MSQRRNFQIQERIHDDYIANRSMFNGNFELVKYKDLKGIMLRVHPMNIMVMYFQKLSIECYVNMLIERYSIRIVKGEFVRPINFKDKLDALESFSDMTKDLINKIENVRDICLKWNHINAHVYNISLLDLSGNIDHELPYEYHLLRQHISSSVASISSKDWGFKSYAPLAACLYRDWRKRNLEENNKRNKFKGLETLSEEDRRFAFIYSYSTLCRKTGTKQRAFYGLISERLHLRVPRLYYRAYECKIRSSTMYKNATREKHECNNGFHIYHSATDSVSCTLVIDCQTTKFSNPGEQPPSIQLVMLAHRSLERRMIRAGEIIESIYKSSGDYPQVYHINDIKR